MKLDHERWVREKLSDDDSEALRDGELYAGYIDEWGSRVGIESWMGWTSYLLSDGQPSIHSDRLAELKAAGVWLLARVWPGRHEKLECAIRSFSAVLADLVEILESHLDRTKRGDDRYLTSKFYKKALSELEYRALLARYNYHIDLVQDLTLELTRAANYVCDMVRMSIDQWYRLKEGVLLVESGPTMNFSYVTLRTEYQGSERTEVPYPGLEAFRIQRATRDTCFGYGRGLAIREVDGPIRLVTRTHEVVAKAPLGLNKGDQVIIEEAEEERRGWTRCISTTGETGWIPMSILCLAEDRKSAECLDDFDGSELSVEVGGIVRVLAREEGWGWYQDSRGNRGWIPSDCIG